MSQSFNKLVDQSQPCACGPSVEGPHKKTSDSAFHEPTAVTRAMPPFLSSNATGARVNVFGALVRKAAADSLPFINVQLNAAHKLLTESREPHHTCFFSERRVPAHLSSLSGAEAPILLLDPSVPDALTTRCLLTPSPVGQLSLLHLFPLPHSLVLSSSSPTSSLTTIHTHTHTLAGARSVIPLRALQRRYRCMVALRHWKELLSKCARTF